MRAPHPHLTCPACCLLRPHRTPATCRPPHPQAVFSAQVQHLVDASRPLAAAAPLLEDEAALPDGFRVACLTTFMLMNQLDQLLARMKAHGTLPSGFFSARGARAGGC